MPHHIQLLDVAREHSVSLNTHSPLITPRWVVTDVYRGVFSTTTLPWTFGYWLQ